MDVIEDILVRLREQRRMLEKRLEGLNGSISALEQGYERPELRFPAGLARDGEVARGLEQELGT
jgi:hypothetical protein